MLRTDNALHLLPLPHRVPIVDFKQICIEFAMLGNQLDALVFENLANLFGFKKAWKDGITTHLVLFETENLERSKKLQHLKENKFKNKVTVVDYGWLYDTMQAGKIVKVDDYLV